jgi:hypothetical protein
MDLIGKYCEKAYLQILENDKHFDQWWFIVSFLWLIDTSGVKIDNFMGQKLKLKLMI